MAPGLASDQVLYLRPFQLSWMKNDATVISIGKRRSGKSWLSREIIYEMSTRGMPHGQIYSGTEHVNPFFGKFFPSSFIDKEFTDQKLKVVFKSQKRRIRKQAAATGREDGRNMQNSFLLVFDDMMSDDDIWKKSKYFRKLYVEGRHVNIFFMQTLQYVLGLPPALRDNVDYVFLFATDDKKALEKMHTNYAGIFPSFSMFKDVMAQCTQNHGCLVIDKTASGSLTDKVFFYRAKDPGRFKFGSHAMWRFHDLNYVSDESSSDDECEKTYKNNKGISPTKKLQKTFETFAAPNKKYTVFMQGH